LNEPSFLVARGISIDDVQRYTLLREVASGLAFLHENGICVGDISPKNLLFSLKPHEAVYFVDCDTMRINGVSALPQVETPGWEVPSGEELATIYSDTYKLGLLALRLLACDQDVRNLQHLPSTTPKFLRQIITDTLDNEPEKRPLPTAWTDILGGALEEAQYQKLTAPPKPVTLASASPPPSLRSRPPARRSAPPAAKPPAPSVHSRPPVSPVSQSTPTPGSRRASPSTKSLAVLALAAVAFAAVVVFIVMLANSKSGAPSSSTSERSTYPTAEPSTYPTESAPTASGTSPTAVPQVPAAPKPPATTTTAQPYWEGAWLRNYWEDNQDCNTGGLDYWVVQPGADTGMYALKLACFPRNWTNILNTHCQSYGSALPVGKCAVWDQDSIMSTFGKHGDLLVVALTQACLDRAGLADFHEGPIHQDCVIKP
jgi:serine/threonine protein kinase